MLLMMLQYKSWIMQSIRRVSGVIYGNVDWVSYHLCNSYEYQMPTNDIFRHTILNQLIDPCRSERNLKWSNCRGNSSSRGQIYLLLNCPHVNDCVAIWHYKLQCYFILRCCKITEQPAYWFKIVRSLGNSTFLLAVLLSLCLRNFTVLP